MVLRSSQCIIATGILVIFPEAGKEISVGYDAGNWRD